MNCVASTYDASGKLVGCTEQELISVISVQMYTMFALGTGLYLYKTFTAENWADIAVTIGWGCVSAFTRAKRIVTKYVLPGLRTVLPDTMRTTIADDVIEDLIRVVKDGVETSAYSSVFAFVHDLDARFTEPSCPRRSRAVSDVVDEDVINVHLCDTVTEETSDAIKAQSETTDDKKDIEEEEYKEDKEDKEDNEDKEDAEDNEANEDTEDTEDTEDEEEDDEDTEDEEDEEEEDISELLTRIENHTMQFDFMLSEVPTAQTLEHDSKEGVHVMKYDGFPRDSAGIHFYDRKFVPVDHRMMEVVLQHEGKEYDLNLASPDNFYVAGNKVLDPAFVKWFMLKNHGIQISVHHGSEGVKCDYTIKCVDNTAALHTLQPHNYLHVSLTGFEIQDSGLV
jgi:hypothetical protein